jgi:quinol monooxygenase YgiN
MSHPIKQIVLIDTLPGRAEEQVQAFAWLAPQVRTEAGCLSYQLHRVSGQENSFVLTETWASPAALAAHDASELMQDAAPWLASFRAGPARVLALGEMHPAPPTPPASHRSVLPYLGAGLLIGLMLAPFMAGWWPVM